MLGAGRFEALAPEPSLAGENLWEMFSRSDIAPRQVTSEISCERGDLLCLEIDEQPLSDDEHPLPRRARGSKPLVVRRDSATSKATRSIEQDGRSPASAWALKSMMTGRSASIHFTCAGSDSR